eukprot:TRINITY_DN5979_c0_g1_i9.p1 TRINITY_DN5979_c0_g1~~TRINITY_DN5979_c0_g1_i9.p1  ORF type:complete len:154 (-),score=10.38 TRINITY_DN5979_c0_g1_i9:222-683(-)
MLALLSVVILFEKNVSNPTGNEKMPLILLCLIYFIIAVYALYCGLKLKIVIKKRNFQPSPRFQWHLNRIKLLNYLFVASDFACIFAIVLITCDRKSLSLHLPNQLSETLVMCLGASTFASFLWYFDPNSSRNVIRQVPNSRSTILNHTLKTST